jgi:CBS domain-containing protein
MASPDGSDRRSRPSRITLRRIQRERTGSEVLFAVMCPSRARVMDIAECRGCEDYRGLCIASNDRELFLRCAFRGTPETVPELSEQETSLLAVATVPVRCLAHDASLQSALELLVEQAIGAAPVVDGSGRAIGIVTKTDLLRASHELRASVRDVMSHVVFTLHAAADVSRAAALMAYEGVHHVVITSEDERPIGIVSSLDILRWLARRSGYVIAGVQRPTDAP